MDSRIQVAFCVLVVVGLVQGRPGFLHTGILGYAVVPVSATSQYHTQDVLGQYSYGYTDGLTAKSEVKTLDGVTRGGYTYVDANGIVQSTSYTADALNGFRVAATNLPVPPKAPAVPETPTTTTAAPAPVPPEPADAPVPVEDTPEVAAAKAAHKVAYDAAAAAAAAAPENPSVVSIPGGFAYSTVGVPYYAPHFSTVVAKLHILG